MNVRDLVARLVWKLRGQERFLEKLTPIIKSQQVQSPAELEGLARERRVEIIHADLGPRIYGAAAFTDESPVIVLKPGLDGPHRELTLAHELGHVHLHPEHLADLQNVSLPTVGGRKDAEADIFALLCLAGKCPPQEEIPRIVRYVLTDHKNLPRWWGIFRYFLFYRLRIQIAQCLEAIFLRNRAQGAS